MKGELTPTCRGAAISLFFSGPRSFKELSIVAILISSLSWSLTWIEPSVGRLCDRSFCRFIIRRVLLQKFRTEVFIFTITVDILDEGIKREMSLDKRVQEAEINIGVRCGRMSRSDMQIKNMGSLDT